MMKDKTLALSALMAIAGIVLQLIGSFVFCAANDVWFNLTALSNPVVLIGIVAVVAAVVYAMVVKIISAVRREGDAVLTLALEITITGLLFTVLFTVLFAAYPVLINL